MPMLAFYGLTWWRKRENPQKTTDVGWAATTLPHADKQWQAKAIPMRNPGPLKPKESKYKFQSGRGILTLNLHLVSSLFSKQGHRGLSWLEFNGTVPKLCVILQWTEKRGTVGLQFQFIDHPESLALVLLNWELLSHWWCPINRNQLVWPRNMGTSIFHSLCCVLLTLSNSSNYLFVLPSKHCRFRSDDF